MLAASSSAVLLIVPPTLPITGRARYRAGGERSIVVGHPTLGAALEDLTDAAGDDGVLAEGDAEQFAIKAERAQHRHGVEPADARALIGRGDDAAGAGLHQAQDDRSDLDRCDPILGVGWQSREHQAGTE